MKSVDLVKAGVILALTSLALVGCDRNSGQGGTQNDNHPMVTGRGSGEQGDSGGNGKPYDRGGPPNVSTSDVPGTGRIDQGGGPTTGEKPKSSVSTNGGTNAGGKP